MQRLRSFQAAMRLFLLSPGGGETGAQRQSGGCLNPRDVSGSAIPHPALRATFPLRGKVGFLASLFLFSALPAAAQTVATATAPDPEPALLLEAAEWRAFAAGPPEQRVCYMTHTAGAVTAAVRGDHRPAVYVTHRPHKNAFSVVVVATAQKYKADTVAIVRIGVEEFRMFTVGDLAWAPDSTHDLRLVRAMRDAAAMTVRGLNEQGKLVEESVSLMGFTAAHNRISAECKPR